MIWLKKYQRAIFGIFIGGLYGLLMRYIFGISYDVDFADLFSITFVWILPIIVGLTPLLFAPKEDLHDLEIRISRPILSVLAFFILCYWTGQEDIICILIISLPFLIVAGTSGIILGGLVLRYRQRKGILYSLFFIPLLTGLIEPTIETPSEKYVTSTSIIIKAGKSEVWKNIVRVNNIQNEEYQKGFFNLAGIPRPLYAELDKDTIDGNRIGHFEGGLKFQEKIKLWDKENLVTFQIEIIPSESKRTIFEKHMLNGEHFKFLSASYSLNQISSDKTELLLTTNYQLNTKINFYGEFWGEQLLTDFQERLLKVIKSRCEI